MILTYIKRIIWFAGLILLQVLILNNIHVAGYATPFLYSYFIVKLNSGVSRNEAMLWSFLMGLCIDIFSNTPGMNAAAAVLLAFARPLFIRLFSPRDSVDDFEPGFNTMGFSPFIKYITICVLLLITVLLAIESFSMADFPVLFLKIISSTLLTILCILAIDGIRR